MSAMLASVSTFWTSVGRPRTPRSNGRGGTKVGLRGAAVQPVARARSPRPRRIARERRRARIARAPPAAAARRSRWPWLACAPAAPRPTAMTICLAPTAAAAAAAPSSTRCGLMRMSSASLWLAGSPSTPFATTTGSRPAATGAQLRGASGSPRRRARAARSPRRPRCSACALAAQRRHAAVALEVRGERRRRCPRAGAAAGRVLACAAGIAATALTARPAGWRRAVLGRAGRRLQQAQRDGAGEDRDAGRVDGEHPERSRRRCPSRRRAAARPATRGRRRSARRARRAARCGGAGGS